MNNSLKSCETMNTKFDETVFDFDLNFLQQSSINVVNDNRFEKQQKALLIAKKKTIATDSLIRKYYAKQEQLEQSESILLAAKEECKQVCIDYKNTLERCSLLEKEAENCKTKNEDLESKLVLAQNQCDAFKSHAHQLQLLVKEHEKKIEALAVEKQLEKKDVNLMQNATLQKENEVFLNHIYLLKDIVLGKKKLEKKHKLILQKYEKEKNKKFVDEDDIVDSSSEDSLITPSDLDIDFSDIKNGQDEHLNKQEILEAKNYRNSIRDTKENCEFDDDSDCSNSEFISEDTGCGSSVTFSDGEKCFNSPDYFINDSPLEAEHGKNKNNTTLVTTATSPHRTFERNEIATSPIIFDDEALLNDTPGISYNNTDTNTTEYFITDIPLSTEIVTIKEKRKLLDVGTSPIRDIERVNTATSPVIFIENSLSNEGIECSNIIAVNEASTCSEINEPFDTNVLTQNPSAKLPTLSNLSSDHELEICEKFVLEKRCLERHNSKNLLLESNSDEEIEMILNTMRLNHKILTPIPETPSKSKRTAKSDKIVTSEKHESSHYVCPGVAKLNEQHKVLQSSIANLSKDILSIKCMLQNQILSSQLPIIEVNSKCNNQVNSEIYDTTSQEAIIEDVNDKLSMYEKVIESVNTINISELENLESVNTINISELNNLESLETEEQFAQDEVVLRDWNLDLTGDSDNLVVSNCDNDNHVRETLFVKESDVVVSDVNKDRIIFEEGPRTEIEDEQTKHNHKNLCENNVIRRKKLSKLERLKHKCLPKYKIAKASSSLNKSRRPKPKPKPLTALRCNDTTDALVILNNKTAYEKALKVMSEIKSKEKKKKSYLKSSSFRKPVTQDSQSLSPQKEKSNNIEPAKERHTNPSPTMLLDVVVSNKNLIDQDKRKRNNNSINKNDMLRSPSTDSVSVPISNTITTRSRSRRVESLKAENLQTVRKISESNNFNHKSIEKNNGCGTISPKLQDSRKQLKRGASKSPERSCKRVLRSSNVKEMCNNYSNIEEHKQQVDTNNTSFKSIPSSPRSIPNSPKYIPTSPKSIPNSPHYIPNSPKSIPNSPKPILDSPKELKVVINSNDIVHDRLLHSREVVKYIDFDEISNNTPPSNLVQEAQVVENISKKIHRVQHDKDLVLVAHNELDTNINKPQTSNGDGKENSKSYPKSSILCHMIEKYGKKTIRFTPTKVSDKISSTICKKLEDDIAHIIQLHNDKSKPAMNELVEDIQRMNSKSFITGFMMYLKDPARKRELFNKVNAPPAPAMTKSEQIILYVVKQLNTRSSDAVTVILTNIEFTLFQLNRTPDFDVVESMSHLYALICRYFGFKHRLRLFILDAMYCLQYKVIPIIKQCLEVWMHILPLAHMGIAKTPLVTCLVYLLHFYKCEDRCNRVQDIRFILSKKYFYQISDWNEMKILEMFKNAIKELTDISKEVKILRTALIILAKRLGAKWCQKNIIKNILLPMIEEDVSENAKRFCVTMIGPLMKPFPADMKVHCEIMVNQLLDMLQQNPSDGMKEAIFTSLIYMSKHNQFRVTQSLLHWEPPKVSREFEDLLCDFVREKPVKTWMKVLPKMT